MTSRLWPLLAALCVLGSAQARTAADKPPFTQVSLSHLDERAIHDGAVTVGAAVSIPARGTAKLPANGAALDVQLVARRVYDGLIVVSEPGHVALPQRGGATSTWTIPAMSLVKPDLGRGWTVTAVVTQGGTLAAGIADDEAVRRAALSRSADIRVAYSTDPAPSPPAGACAIELTTVRDVSGQAISASRGDIEVGLSSEVSGTVDNPPGVYMVLSVKPAGSPNLWLMSSNRTRHERQWRGISYLGRPGMDFGETFVIQAWLLQRPVAEDREYSDNEWRAIAESACARSAGVLVRRRVGPGDLKITRVDTSFVGSAPTPIATNTEPDIEGQIEDMQPAYALRPGETVWILTRLAGTEGWRVAAMAVVQADRLSWRAPAVRFVQPGEHQVLAIAALTRMRIGRVLSSDDWFALARANLVRRLSRSVTVLPVRQTQQSLESRVPAR